MLVCFVQRESISLAFLAQPALYTVSVGSAIAMLQKKASLEDHNIATKIPSFLHNYRRQMIANICNLMSLLAIFCLRKEAL